MDFAIAHAGDISIGLQFGDALEWRGFAMFRQDTPMFANSRHFSSKILLTRFPHLTHLTFFNSFNGPHPTTGFLKNSPSYSLKVPRFCPTGRAAPRCNFFAKDSVDGVRDAWCVMRENCEHG
jgi:hypothetical protein